MNDQQYIIELEDDAEGHRFVPDDAEMRDALANRGPGTRIRLSPIDEDDTEGHTTTPVVRVQAFLDEDDTEGHAISVHFPSREEADAFRRRLLAAGLIAATVAIGAVGAGALSSVDTGSSGSQTVVSERAAPPNSDAAAEASSAGVRDVRAVRAETRGAATSDTQATDADADIGIMDASGAAAGMGSADENEPPDPRIGPR